MEKIDTRIAVLGIIVENRASFKEINELLHRNAGFIRGRFGLPEVREGISVISVILDAPCDVVNSLTGKLGMIEGVKAKTLLR